MREEIRFRQLPIHEDIKRALDDMGMENLTPIQYDCFPHIIKNKDVMGAAKTGSGKTLAFLVPLVHKLLKNQYCSSLGVIAIIISPVRELSIQIYDQLKLLTKYTNITSGLLIGGNDRDEEVKLLKSGLTVVVATPGRLLDHMNNSYFMYKSFNTLIIDEADRLMEQGFLVEMRAIINKLPKNRQTLLFSATLNISAATIKSKMKQMTEDNINTNSKKKSSIEDKVIKLACYSLKGDCQCVDLSKEDENGTLETGKTFTNSKLEQICLIFNLKDKFRTLYFLLDKASDLKEKNIVFLATNASVNFYYNLLKFIEYNKECPLFRLCGDLSNSVRERNLQGFKKAKHGVLLCTDVAGRGLDIPLINWVIQYDPPGNILDYVHRVGRTARAGNSGNAILFLNENELSFINNLKQHNINVEEKSINPSRLNDNQETYEKLVDGCNDLKRFAIAAFQSVVAFYRYHKMKCFKEEDFDMELLSKTFGLKFVPLLNEKGPVEDHFIDTPALDETKPTEPPKKKRKQR